MDSSASGAAIQWGAPVTISGEPDVATSGTLAYAYDNSNASTTVNGVPFAAGNSGTAFGANVAMSGFVASSTGAFGSGSGSPWNGLTSAYQTMLRGGAYAGNNSPATVTLKNLSVGHVYLVQVWVNDNRSGGTVGRTQTVSGGGNTVTLAYNSTGAAGGVGQHCTGTFTANAATQAFTLTGVLPAGNNSSQLNAIQVRNLGRSLTWRGSGNVWDVGTTSNWLCNAAATTFAQGDFVTFDDSGIASPSVQLNGSLAPTLVTVSSSGNYTFSGAGLGNLTGGMALAKSGGGTLTLAPASVVTSITTTSGDLTATVASASGLLAGMYVTGTGIPAGTTVTGITGNTVTLSQAATSNSTSNGTFYQKNAWTGNTTISGGTLALAGYQQSGIGSGPVVLQGGTLSLNGVTGSNSTDQGTFSNSLSVPAGQSGTWKLMQRGNIASVVTGPADSTLNVQVAYIRGNLAGNWSGFAGTINVSGSAGSEFRVGNGNGFGTATINLGSGVIMDQSFNPPNDGLNGGTTQVIGMLTGSGTLGGQPVAGRVVNWQVGGNNASGNFNGVIQDASTNGSGAARITKVGTGTWTLANPSTYSGSTTVSAGTLVVNGLPNSSGVKVAPGAALGGSGTINGPVTIEMDSVFQPGNSLVFAGGVHLVQPDASSMTLQFGETGSGFGVLNARQLHGGTVSAAGSVEIHVNVQNGNLVAGTYVLADGGVSGSGTARVQLTGASGNLIASLDADSQPGKLLLVLRLRAFPGAEGYGAVASGGRGGSVYHVTNLNDSGAGSFRDAVSQPNRTVVFDVGGVINLINEVEVMDNVTIAGQTAPGQGIAITGETVYLNHGFGSVTSFGRSNIIIRHVRFRAGYKEVGDTYSLGLKPAHNVMLDHCSIEVGNWQTLSISYNTTTGERPTDITVQNCIVGASVSNQLAALCWSPQNLTFHHNLFIDNGGRDPKTDGNMQVINDVIYNFRLGIYGNGSGTEVCDFVGNYHINGPGTHANSLNTGINVDNTDGTYFVSGNLWDNNLNGMLDGNPLVSGSGSFAPNLSATRFCDPVVPVTEDSALLAYHKVVSMAGCSLSRDPLDAELISQVKSLGTQGPGPDLYMKHLNPYPNPTPWTGSAIPAWTVTGGTAPTDTDGDGMPDDWEKANGSDVNVADHNVLDDEGYTKLETYLHWMAEPHARVWEYATSTIDLSQFADGFTNHTPVFSIAQPSHGSATLLPDGRTLQYTPSTNYEGLDEVVFTVTASNGSVMTRTLGILVNRSGKSLKWKGGLAGNAWDGLSQNWLDAGASALFRNGDTVIFDDSGSANPVVQLTGTLYPGAVNVSNTTAVSYSLTGSGQLAGEATVTKSGTGTLGIDATCAHSGGTVVNGGILNLTGNQAAADGGLALNLANSSTATLNLGSTSQAVPTSAVVASGKSVQVGAVGTGYTGNSAQTLNVDGAALFPTSVTNHGQLLVGRNAATNIRSNVTWNQNGPLTVRGVGGYSASMSISGTALVNYQGTADIAINPDPANTSNATLTVNGGTLVTSRGFAFGGSTSTGVGILRLTGGGKLRLAADVPDLIGGATSGRFELGNSGGEIDTAGFSTATSKGMGNVSGQTGSLTKSGAGTLTLTGTMTYTGATWITGGTLAFNGSASTSAFTVASGGTLRGVGTTGSLHVQSGGVLAPGAVSPGTLTSGALTLASGSTCQFRLGTAADRVAVTGALALGGTLSLSDAGGLVSGTYTLFTYTGAFTGSASITPPPGFVASLDTSTPGVIKAILGSGGYEVWAQQQFTPTELANPAISGPSATPAHDGLSNLLKYALGLPAKTPSTAGVTLSKDGPLWVFSYQRPANRPDITYAVEISTSPSGGSWTTSGVTHVRSVVGDHETWQGSASPGSSGRLFFRLRIVRP
jgi:autotransporter-associated beta strand protein